MKYNKFDVIVTEFPFIEDINKRKVRPAIIISSNEYNKQTGFVVIAMITSAKHSNLWSDIEIKIPSLIDLKSDSIIRMKFSNILQSNIITKLGIIDDKTKVILQNRLKNCFEI